MNIQKIYNYDSNPITTNQIRFLMAPFTSATVLHYDWSGPI